MPHPPNKQLWVFGKRFNPDHLSASRVSSRQLPRLLRSIHLVSARSEEGGSEIGVLDPRPDKVERSVMSDRLGISGRDGRACAVSLVTSIPTARPTDRVSTNGRV